MAVSCRVAALLLIGLGLVMVQAATRLQLLGQASLPTGGATGPGVEQVAYDDRQKVAYLIGGNTLYVIDMSPDVLLDGVLTGEAPATPRALPVLQNLTRPTTLNDVSFCGGYLAISANGPTKVLPGSVTIFSWYVRPQAAAAAGEDAGDDKASTAGGRPTARSLELLAEFTVGALPDQLEFSKDCQTILVSNEGEPETYSPASLANDPEGSVSVINLFYCDSIKHNAYPREAEETQQQDAEAAGSGYGKKGGSHKKKPRRFYPDDDAPPKKYRSDQPNDEPCPYGTNCPPKRPPKPDYAPTSKPSPPYGPYEPEAPQPQCRGAKILGSVRTADFRAWNNRKDELLANGVKINGIDATVAQDLEPEYTTFSEDEKIAFVSLQENSAIAVLDVEAAKILNIYALGFKNHSAPSNPLDVSDRDNQARILNWPVFGMYQPDEMRAFEHEGSYFVVTANEGDARSYPGLNEETRAGSNAVRNNLNTTVFTQNIATFFNNTNLGRLNVLTNNSAPFQPFSDPYNTTKFSKLFSFGARSFSIWRLDMPMNGQLAEARLVQVYDSGDQLEEISSGPELIDIWNSELVNYRNSSWDQRSDNKGPEPEGVTMGTCGDAPESSRYGGDDAKERRCLYLGTERLGVVFVFDITDPYNPVFQSFARPPQPNPANELTRLSAPEGMHYARYRLGYGRSFPMVLVAYEADSSNSTLPSGLGVYKVVDN